MNMRQQNGQNGNGRHRGRGGRHGGGNRGHGGGGHGGSGGQGGNRGQVPLRNQVFDSHGPDGVRVRGNAFQVWEKYMAMAREAGEREEAENLYQHAEHYYRIIQVIQEHEAEHRARFQPSEQPSADAQGTDGDAQPADPFAPASDEGTSSLTTLTPAAAQ